MALGVRLTDSTIPKLPSSKISSGITCDRRKPKVPDPSYRLLMRGDVFMWRVPFLRPTLPTLAEYAQYIDAIDQSHVYSNFGRLTRELESKLTHLLWRNDGAVATVNNATVGLILSIRALMRGGHYAVMPSFTFAATPAAAMWCGLEPYFVDVDPHSWCLDVGKLGAAVAELGSNVAAVIPYATFGTPLDLTPYKDLVERGVPVVVDAAASLGTFTDAGHFGQNFPGALVFSMHATKPFGIGEGGLVYSADRTVAATVHRLSNFGLDENRSAQYLGLNGKLSEYAAARALAVLLAYEAHDAARRQLVRAYTHAIERFDLLHRGWQFQIPAEHQAVQFLPCLVPPHIDRAEVVEALRRQGVQARSYFHPACHQQPAFAAFANSGLPVTNTLANRVLSLPLWEGMTSDDISMIVECLAGL